MSSSGFASGFNADNRASAAVTCAADIDVPWRYAYESSLGSRSPEFESEYTPRSPLAFTSPPGAEMSIPSP